jgi:hypothetical protein
MNGQDLYGIYAYSDDLYSSTLTAQVKPARDTLAEAAMTRLSGDFGVVGITQVVSSSGVENWDVNWPRQAVYRKGVSSVNLSAETWDSGVRGRLILSFWS